MTSHITTASLQSKELEWLATEFVRQTPGVAHTVVVSADGLLLAASNGLGRERGEQLAAISSGLASLTQGAARCFEAGNVMHAIVEMELGYLFLTSISEGACLTVLAAPGVDLGVLTYESTLLVDRVGEQMTPELRAQLRGARHANST